MRRCPTDCDSDCEDGCHEFHQVPWKRTHNPIDCPAEDTSTWNENMWRVARLTPGLSE